MRRNAVRSIVVLTFCAIGLLATWNAAQPRAEAHCQVPCGIYDDEARIKSLREDATTIARAAAQIQGLALKHDAQSLNQATRWILTKEQHATNIITIVSEYFLTQKVKPVPSGGEGYEGYLRKLADHHAVLTAAMKTKQTADPSAYTVLAKAIDGMARHYTSP